MKAFNFKSINALVCSLAIISFVSGLTEEVMKNSNSNLRGTNEKAEDAYYDNIRVLKVC